MRYHDRFKTVHVEPNNDRAQNILEIVINNLLFFVDVVDFFYYTRGETHPSFVDAPPVLWSTRMSSTAS